MSNSWPTAELGSICAFENGDRGSNYPSRAHRAEAGIPFINAGHLAENGIDFAAMDFIPRERFSLLGGGKVRPYDILFCLRGSLGKFASVGALDEGAIASSLVILRPGAELCHGFLLAYLGSHLCDAAIEKYRNGAAQPNLSSGSLKKFLIPFPPLPEQQRIVAILNEAFEGIAAAKANAEKNLQRARELFAVYADLAFADDLTSGTTCLLGAVASFRNGINYTKHSKGESVRIVGVKDFKDNFWTPPNDLDEVILDGTLNGNDTLSPGDILAVRSNGNPELIGRTMLVDDFVGPVTHSGFTIRIRVESADVLPRYVCHFLKSPKSRRTLVEGGNGASIRSLNQGTLAAMVMPFPSIDAQRATCGAIEKVKVETARLEYVYRRKLAALDELKKSLLHQAFSGQLTSSKHSSIAPQAALQTTTPEFAANVICLAYARHERQQREKTFGRVKEQKVLHLAESIAKIDMGRHPMKDAAGPNDFQHMLNAETWAKSHNFFEMVKREGGYDFKKLSAFDEHLSHAHLALAPYLLQLEHVVDLLVPMGTEEAEVFATVHAAWNNLLIERMEPTDDAIVLAARDHWHADKLKIDERKFRHAIAQIREKGLVPDGTAKYVGGQQALFE